MSADDPNNIVHLNVGGVRHTTFLGTLRRHPDSILAALFRHPISAPRDSRDPNNAYFLDRNGEVFGIILDYLRSGTLVVPRDTAGYTSLRREVAFYGLPIIAQLPPIQPLLWQAAPRRYLHARIVVDQIEKVIEWEEGPFPQDLYAKTIEEIVKFFGAKGYHIAAEYAKKGAHGLSSIWMVKEEVYPGAEVPIEIVDRPVGTLAYQPPLPLTQSTSGQFLPAASPSASASVTPVNGATSSPRGGLNVSNNLTPKKNVKL